MSRLRYIRALALVCSLAVALRIIGIVVLPGQGDPSESLREAPKPREPFVEASEGAAQRSAENGDAVVRRFVTVCGER